MSFSCGQLPEGACSSKESLCSNHVALAVLCRRFLYDLLYFGFGRPKVQTSGLGVCRFLQTAMYFGGSFCCLELDNQGLVTPAFKLLICRLENSDQKLLCLFVKFIVIISLFGTTVCGGILQYFETWRINSCYEAVGITLLEPGC